jgi:hypothetical protein
VTEQPTGDVAAEHARSLARIAGDRGDADYNVSSVFAVGDVDDDLARAAAFVRAVRGVLGHG